METENFAIWSPDNSDQYALVQDLARMADDIDEALQVIVDDQLGTGDVLISLNGGWTVEPGTTGSPPSFRVRSGIVSLNGRIRAGTGATPHAFTLPVGARPTTERVTSVMTPANTFETLIVSPNGEVRFFNLSIPSNDYRLASVPGWAAA